ncbi:helix-turn-helix domain-containing protein [Streptomyces xanthophaeus]
MNRPWLATAADAAYYTGRPVGTIWRWASEGRISRHGKGKAARYDLRDLNAKAVDPWTDEVTPGEPPPLPAGARAA